MTWTVRLHHTVNTWLRDCDINTREQIKAAIGILQEEGPTLRRPLVDVIKTSRHKNMKELRPGSAGDSEIRILFAFDPLRQAVLLVAGDKCGEWNKWYQENVPLADQRLDEWNAKNQPSGQQKTTTKRKRS